MMESPFNSAPEVLPPENKDEEVTVFCLVKYSNCHSHWDYWLVAKWRGYAFLMFSHLSFRLALTCRDCGASFWEYPCCGHIRCSEWTRQGQVYCSYKGQSALHDECGSLWFKPCITCLKPPLSVVNHWITFLIFFFNFSRLLCPVSRRTSFLWCVNMKNLYGSMIGSKIMKSMQVTL